MRVIVGVLVQGALAATLLAAGAGHAQMPPPEPGLTPGREDPVVIYPGMSDGMARDYRVHVRLRDKGTLIYMPGQYTQSIHIGGDFGFTSGTVKASQVTWPPNVVLDGRSGEWSWGKAMFLVSGAEANTTKTFQTSASIQGFLIQGVGNKEAPSGGASGAMAERGSSMYVRDCDFEDNANGAGAYDGAELLDVRDSAFSLTRGNGAGDGKSHDAYVSAKKNIFSRIIVGGLGTGNDIKIRAPYGRIDQSFLVASTGRWLDAPWGGDMAVSNSVLVQKPHAESDNMFGYAEEGSNLIDAANPASRKITYINDLFVITKWSTAVFINDGEMEFINCRWLFVQTDDTPPTLKIYASDGTPGKVTGLPFPVARDGTVQIPASAIIHDPSVIPPTPQDPHKLPEVLAKLLPGPIVSMP